MTEGNGEFKGSTTARLNRIEEDLKEVRANQKITHDKVDGINRRLDRWAGALYVGGFGLPIVVSIVVHFLFR